MENFNIPKIQYFEGALKNSYRREHMGGTSLLWFSHRAVCLLIITLRASQVAQW